MRQCIVTLLVSLLLVMTVSAASKTEVPLVVQITSNERSSMPDKTIELEVRQIKFGKKCDRNFAQQLQQLMSRVADADETHYVFVVTLQPNGDGIDLAISSEDILMPDKLGKGYHGTMILERRHFVFAKTRDNEALLKSLLDKDSGKVTYVREFEIVEHKVISFEALLMARWRTGQLHVSAFEANGVNQLDNNEQ